MTVNEILAAGGASLFRPLCGNASATCPGERVGNVPRNSLRADGVVNMDPGDREEHQVCERTEHPGPHRVAQRV